VSPVVPAILVLAVLVGWAMGGRLRRFETVRIHWWALAIGGLALQFFALPAVGGFSRSTIGAAALILSYVLLLAFLAINRWVPAAKLMALGLLLNLVVVALNGGMPVTARAVELAGGSVDYVAANESAKHHLATEDDLLVFLGDVIPVPEPVGIVLSIGDVLLYVGVAWFVIQVMRGRSRENPRPLAMWFPSYRGKHAPSYWRLPARYRGKGHAEAVRSGIGP
jgi:uncharacterized protein DUF5317